MTPEEQGDKNNNTNEAKEKAIAQLVSHILSLKMERRQFLKLGATLLVGAFGAEIGSRKILRDYIDEKVAEMEKLKKFDLRYDYKQILPRRSGDIAGKDIWNLGEKETYAPFWTDSSGFEIVQAPQDYINQKFNNDSDNVYAKILAQECKSSQGNDALEFAVGDSYLASISSTLMQDENVGLGLRYAVNGQGPKQYFEAVQLAFSSDAPIKQYLNEHPQCPIKLTVYFTPQNDMPLAADQDTKNNSQTMFSARPTDTNLGASNNFGDTLRTKYVPFTEAPPNSPAKSSNFVVQLIRDWLGITTPEEEAALRQLVEGILKIKLHKNPEALNPKLNNPGIDILKGYMTKAINMIQTKYPGHPIELNLVVNPSYVDDLSNTAYTWPDVLNQIKNEINHIYPEVTIKSPDVRTIVHNYLKLTNTSYDDLFRMSDQHYSGLGALVVSTAFKRAKAGHELDTNSLAKFIEEIKAVKQFHNNVITKLPQ